MRSPVAILGPVIVLAVLAYNSCFVVRQTEMALVTQFGNPVSVVLDPGLNFKMPFTQSVEYFDKRLLEYTMTDPEEIEINASDEKRIRLGAFVRWRIVDPLAFVRATRSAGIGGNRISTMKTQIASLLSSSLGQAIGKVPMNALLSPERDNIMKEIRELMTKQAMSSSESDAKETSDQTSAVNAPSKSGYGIEIVDVRIVKADLPQENSDAVFKRMKAERAREAATYRAKGNEESQRITATADRDVTVIKAEAQKKAEIMRGEGDAAASKIFADAFGKDPEFFEFYRTLQAYRLTLTPKDTTIVLSPDSGFMKQFGKTDAH